MRPRRSSVVVGSYAGGYGESGGYRAGYSNPFVSSESRRPRTAKSGHNSQDNDDDEDETNERAPLISTSGKSRGANQQVGYGSYSGDKNIKNGFGSREDRRNSSRSSGRSQKKTIFDKQTPTFPLEPEYDVNNPPSVPASPVMGAQIRDMSFEDVMVRDDFGPGRASPRGMDDESAIESSTEHGSMPNTPRDIAFQGRRHTVAGMAEEDVCFPVEGMSEMADDDEEHDDTPMDGGNRREGRRRRGKWPDLAQLEEWSRHEKEGRSEERRVRKITEPALIGGRLRPIHKGWHRAEDDAPYRFTYFNEQFQSTIHSQSISELVQPGSSFRELFIPDRPILDDSSSDESEDEGPPQASYLRHATGGANGESRAPTRQGSLIDRPESRRSTVDGKDSGDATPSGVRSPLKEVEDKPKRYGDRPTFWLDVLSPTEAEMKVLSKTFGIHPLTAEDIMMQEAREKVELFRNYYFVNYRTFEQDMNNEDFLEPVNMYVVVFREGVISFHFSMTPHPANVRRRIRQLQDYLILTSDWISYAIIDDITDVFAPLIQNIEDEVDEIDDAILRMHSPEDEEERKSSSKDNEKKSEAGDGTTGDSGGDMLRRVGNCRKKVMGLYRLLGNKADVIKGFAKRCNEHWEVAPRSEIGLYLGDIQDHIVTMTGNLSHYEKYTSLPFIHRITLLQNYRILARSHGNYLAQINIRMNERQEQTADVLGKLTVLGTIVLPMNIITGLWGMNVWVPGQEYEGNLAWFWCITGGLLVFGLACYLIAKTLYRIV